MWREPGEDTMKDSLPSDTLDLSRKSLQCVSEDVLKMSRIKHLYLRGNELSSVPEHLFSSLSHLVWLDVRNNKITRLPSEIGQHRCLKTLLLEGNPIKELPVELGNVNTLRALSLRHCPIEFPPQDVVHQGLHSILSFLRSKMADKPVDVRDSEQEVPPVEKLQLTELAHSLDVSEEWASDRERQRFEELKQELRRMEEADIGDAVSHETLRPSHPTATDSDGGPRSRVTPRDQELLRDWRAQTKSMQEKREREHKQGREGPGRRDEVVKSAPYATHPELHGRMHLNIQGPGASTQNRRTERSSQERAAGELEQRVRAHVQAVQERRRAPRGSAQEEQAAAWQDMEAARQLRCEAAQRTLESDAPLQRCFTGFTGETAAPD
ncbi:leucine-rich repeat-containing protein 27 isoform X2 [Amia ocellicauda]|uniref:leucine-rich repeat-containing protein 27 isoform X2 n=1 Tax=Amia ocellicauda TaxID=2972642 RepID=UPI0034645C78